MAGVTLESTHRDKKYESKLRELQRFVKVRDSRLSCVGTTKRNKKWEKLESKRSLTLRQVLNSE